MLEAEAMLTKIVLLTGCLLFLRVKDTARPAGEVE